MQCSVVVVGWVAYCVWGPFFYRAVPYFAFLSWNGRSWCKSASEAALWNARRTEVISKLVSHAFLFSWFRACVDPLCFPIARSVVFGSYNRGVRHRPLGFFSLFNTKQWWSRWQFINFRFLLLLYVHLGIVHLILISAFILPSWDSW